MSVMFWVGILIAAVAGFMVGGLWYGPLFGKAWMKERGVTPEAAKDSMNMPLIFGTTFLLNLVASALLAHIFVHIHPDPATAVMISGGIAVGFIATSIGVNYLFSRMSLKLFLIDAGYWIAIYLVMGAVLAFLH